MVMPPVDTLIPKYAKSWIEVGKKRKKGRPREECLKIDRHDLSWIERMQKTGKDDMCRLKQKLPTPPCRDNSINPFQPSVAFHVETSYLIYSANQMIGFYMKCYNWLKWY